MSLFGYARWTVPGVRPCIVDDYLRADPLDPTATLTFIARMDGTAPALPSSSPVVEAVPAGYVSDGTGLYEIAGLGLDNAGKGL